MSGARRIGARRSALALAVLALLAAPMAQAEVLSFEDIGADGAVPLNYGGLDWSAGGWLAFGTEQAPYTAHSGSWRITSDWGSSNAASEIRFATPVVFDGAWFAGLEGATLRFELWSGGVVVAQSALLDPSATPSFLASGYSGTVDAVRVNSGFHANWVLDDLSFTAAVPEPQPAALLLAGLASITLLAALRRTRG